MANLSEIESATKLLADHRELLKLRIENLQTDIEALKRKALPDIKQAAGDAANAHSALQTLIDESRGLFTKPRSIVYSGIRVGLKKGMGTIQYDDEAAVISKVEKLFPGKEEREMYIKITKKLRKGNLEDLDAITLKKIGVTIEGTGDVILIKPVDSDIDKIVNVLIKESVEGAEEL